MKRIRPVGNATLAILAGLFCAAATARAQSGGASRSASEPASGPPALQALRAATRFTQAVYVGNGQEVYPLLDAIGYQRLPLSGPLPADPGRPMTPAAVARLVDSLGRHGKLQLDPEAFSVVKREQLRRWFPAAARWMSPQDYAVVIEPGGLPGDWLGRRCCLVVRIRGRRAQIIGGNLFSAIRAAPPARPDAAGVG